MLKQQPENASTLQSATKTLAVALFVARTWATSLELFLHRGVGQRYLGWQAAAVWLLVPCYGLAWEGYDLRPLMLFLLAYLLMCFGARMGMLARRLRGDACHSMYTGWPRLLRQNAKITELTMKRFYEPVFMFLFGFTVRELVDPPLGTYFMIGAVCLFISVSTSDMASRLRSFDLNDAAIEQEIITERFREMRGDGG